MWLDRIGTRTAITYIRDGVVQHDCHRNRQHLGVLLYSHRDSESVGSRSGRGNNQHDGKYFFLSLAILICISEHADGIIYGGIVGGGRGRSYGSDTDIVGAETTKANH